MVVRFKGFSIDAKIWCLDHIGDRYKMWECRFCVDTKDYEFTFKNDADATWFALVHGDRLV